MIELDSVVPAVQRGMSCGFVGPDSPEWRQVLEQLPHDYYHLPRYLEFVTRFNKLAGTLCAFLARQDAYDFFAPLLIRPVRSPFGTSDESQWLDASSLPGDPSLIVGWPRSQVPAAFLRRALDAFVASLRERHVVTCFLWLHPLLLPDVDLLRSVGHLTHHKLSVSIDLTLPSDELWRQTRASHRRAITRACREGQTARIDPTPAGLETFVQMYQETMRRVGARDHWYLSHEYFEGLKDALSERLHLCVVERDGELVCGGLFSEESGVIQYMYGATRTQALPHAPAKTMINFMTMWGKDRGDHTFHLGGGATSDDNLFHFKIGFSSRVHPVLSWRIVVDTPAYQRLTAEWEAREGRMADGPDGFFPAYRKPSLA